MAFDLPNFEQETADFRKYRITRFILHPDQWEEYPNRVTLEWKVVKFNTENATLLPTDKKGVYSFIVQPGIADHPLLAYPLYIGMTKENFRARYRYYLREPSHPKSRPLITEMLTKWSEHLYFVYAPIENENIIKDVEEDLLAALIPPRNSDFPAKIQPFVTAALG